MNPLQNFHLITFNLTSCTEGDHRARWQRQRVVSREAVQTSWHLRNLEVYHLSDNPTNVFIRISRNTWDS